MSVPSAERDHACVALGLIRERLVRLCHRPALLHRRGWKHQQAIPGNPSMRMVGNIATALDTDVLSGFWTKAPPHLPPFSLGLAMFVMGFNTSVTHFDHPHDNFAKVKGMTEHVRKLPSSSVVRELRGVERRPEGRCQACAESASGLSYESN
jgi:hypothetical protein